ncbi:MAG: preprotein translocase subunit SecE [Desulfovibrionales bacterium]|jgi:preprotein translocase subunit SecE|nr:preprotein translocase subunit SecE [Desulfovibrionales bacterium]
MAKKRKKTQGQETAGPSTVVSPANKLKEFKEFFEQSKVEIKKVAWPTRKETVATCVAVLALVAVMAVFLGLVDLSVSKLVQIILS